MATQATYGRARVTVALDTMTFEVKTKEVKSLEELPDLVADKVEEHCEVLIDHGPLREAEKELRVLRAKIAHYEKSNPQEVQSSAVRRPGTVAPAPSDGPARRAAAAKDRRNKRKERRAAAEEPPKGE